MAWSKAFSPVQRSADEHGAKPPVILCTSVLNYSIISTSFPFPLYFSTCKAPGSSCFSITKATHGVLFWSWTCLCFQSRVGWPQSDLERENQGSGKHLPLGASPDTNKDPKIGSSWADCRWFQSKGMSPKLFLAALIFQMRWAFVQLCYMRSSGLHDSKWASRAADLLGLGTSDFLPLEDFRLYLKTKTKPTNKTKKSNQKIPLKQTKNSKPWLLYF